MFADERKIHILKQIDQVGKVSVNDLAELYAVTTATIRNDINHLDEKGLLTKISGGAISKSELHNEQYSDIRESINEQAKIMIGKKAIEYIRDNQTILLDTGTTTYHIAKHIRNFRNLLIVTNDFNVAKILEVVPETKVLFLGGIVKHGYHCTYHNHYSAMLKDLNVDIAFMGVNSLTPEGAFAADIQLAQTKQLMVKRSTQVIVCCDHAKFERKALSKFAKIDEIDVVISDSFPANLTHFDDNSIEWVNCNT